MSPPVTTEPPVARAPLSFDPWDHALMDDPCPTYARLRAEQPLHHHAEPDFWAGDRTRSSTGSASSPESCPWT